MHFFKGGLQSIMNKKKENKGGHQTRYFGHSESNAKRTGTGATSPVDIARFILTRPADSP